jgi:phosphohistidine phosphatase
MEIYLIQHGTSLSSTLDTSESLAPEGKEQAEIIGKSLAKMKIQFDTIITSSKKRANQTASIIAKQIKYFTEKIQETDAVKAMATVEELQEFLMQYSSNAKILIVGHLPSLSNFASFLLSGNLEPIIAIKNCGCCKIDIQDIANKGTGLLKWYVTVKGLKDFNNH